MIWHRIITSSWERHRFIRTDRQTARVQVLNALEVHRKRRWRREAFGLAPKASDENTIHEEYFAHDAVPSCHDHWSTTPRSRRWTSWWRYQILLTQCSASLWSQCIITYANLAPFCRRYSWFPYKLQKRRILPFCLVYCIPYKNQAKECDRLPLLSCLLVSTTTKLTKGEALGRRFSVEGCECPDMRVYHRWGELP